MCTLGVETYMFTCPGYLLWTIFKYNLKYTDIQKYLWELDTTAYNFLRSYRKVAHRIVFLPNKLRFFMNQVLLFMKLFHNLISTERVCFWPLSLISLIFDAKSLLPRRGTLTQSPLWSKGISRIFPCCWALFTWNL